ncbi:hypothetical protein B7463_g6677, partial [Scytalidium lignicola]
MQFSVLLPISLLISYSAAQTASACAAQPVLDACLASTQAIASTCSTTDYQCLCSKWKTVLQCFQQCPNDSRYSSVLSTEETYCTDMSVYVSSTSTPISVTKSPATTTTAAATRTGAADAGVSVSSATSSGAAASHTGQPGGATELMVGAGGMFIAVAGFVGAFL